MRLKRLNYGIFVVYYFFSFLLLIPCDCFYATTNYSPGVCSVLVLLLPVVAMATMAPRDVPLDDCMINYIDQ